MLPLLLLVASAPQTAYPTHLVGKPAPDLKFETVLAGNAVVNAPKIDLKGAVTLLEFWFTTCGPCRQAVPHINKLAREFGPKGLKSYAVTFDKTAAVQEYLKEVPIVSPIAIDTAHATIKPYGVTAFPTTFLIGKDGKVLACANPDAFTEQVIADALAGKPIKVTPTESPAMSAPDTTVPASIIPPVASVQITQNTAPNGASFQMTPERVAFKGVSLRVALMQLYRLDPNQSKMELQPDERIFDMEANLPGAKGEGAANLLKTALAQTFHLSMTTEDRDTKVAVFRKNGPLKGVQTWNGKDRGAQGDRFWGMPLASIIDTAAYMMGMVGIDETGDKTNYDFTLNFDDKKPIPEQVKEIFGLDVTTETRKMPFTLIKQSK